MSSPDWLGKRNSSDVEKKKKVEEGKSVEL